MRGGTAATSPASPRMTAAVSGPQPAMASSGSSPTSGRICRSSASARRPSRTTSASSARARSACDPVVPSQQAGATCASSRPVTRWATVALYPGTRTREVRVEPVAGPGLGDHDRRPEPRPGAAGPGSGQRGAPGAGPPQRRVTRAIANASPGSLLPGRRVRPRSRRDSWGGTSTTSSPAATRCRASDRPVRGASLRPRSGHRAPRAPSPRPRTPRARPARCANARSSRARPSRVHEARRERVLVGVDPDRRRCHRPSSRAPLRWARAGRAAVR